LYSTDYRPQNNGQKLLGSGNYENFMTMIDPRGTSQGRWRIGPVTHPYHQWAREFNADRTPMRFQLNTAFANSLTGDLRMYVRYYDQGTGSWRLTYSSVDNPNKVARTLTNTGTNTWKEVMVTVNDYKFTRSGPNSSDIGLEYVTGDNTAFHMIELQTDRPFTGGTCVVPPAPPPDAGCPPEFTDPLLKEDFCTCLCPDQMRILQVMAQAQLDLFITHLAQKGWLKKFLCSVACTDATMHR
jgi:hypothetical protein